jgi:hypothetical protein
MADLVFATHYSNGFDVRCDRRLPASDREVVSPPPQASRDLIHHIWERNYDHLRKRPSY